MLLHRLLPLLAREAAGGILLSREGSRQCLGLENTVPLQGLFTSHGSVNSDSPETAKSLKPNTNGSGLLMDTRLCHLLRSH